MRHIPTNDHALYEVRLVVAIPTLGTAETDGRHESALDYIVPAITDDLVLLEIAETKLALYERTSTLTVVAQQPQVVNLVTNTNTTTTAVVPKKRGQRGASLDVPNANVRWTDDEREGVVKWYYKGKSVAAIAGAIGRSESAVNNELWRMRQAGEID